MKRLACCMCVLVMTYPSPTGSFLPFSSILRLSLQNRDTGSPVVKTSPRIIAEPATGLVQGTRRILGAG